MSEVVSARRRRLAKLCGWAVVAAACAPAGLAAGLPELVAAARGSVVAIGTFNALDNPRFTFRGSGFAVGDGRQVLTNLHVLPPAGDPAFGSPLTVQRRLDDGRLDPRAATLVATDRRHDLALLKIDGEPLTALPLADGGDAREGQAVAFIGYPIGGLLGFAPVTHRGIVSSVTSVALPAPNAGALGAPAVAALREGAFAVYQLDATAYPGNSGGPLFDVDDGKVIGIVNMVLVRRTRESALTAPSGISYAIPIRHARALLEPR